MSGPARQRIRAGSPSKGTCCDCGDRRCNRASGARSGCSPPPTRPSSSGCSAAEFFTTFTIAIPEGTPAGTVRDTEVREAARAKELAGQGHLLRLWRLPGEGRALGLWRARDTAEMQPILRSLPLDAWMTVETTPLTPHPSDPAAAAS